MTNKWQHEPLFRKGKGKVKLFCLCGKFQTRSVPASPEQMEELMAEYCKHVGLVEKTPRVQGS